jgi:hypothetical protein
MSPQYQDNAAVVYHRDGCMVDYVELTGGK